MQPASRQELNREIVKTLRLFTAACFLLKTPLMIWSRTVLNLLRRCVFDGAAIVAQQLVERIVSLLYSFCMFKPSHNIWLIADNRFFTVPYNIDSFMGIRKPLRPPSVLHHASPPLFTSRMPRPPSFQNTPASFDIFPETYPVISVHFLNRQVSLFIGLMS